MVLSDSEPFFQQMSKRRMKPARSFWGWSDEKILAGRQNPDRPHTFASRIEQSRGLVNVYLGSIDGPLKRGAGYI